MTDTIGTQRHRCVILTDDQAAEIYSLKSDYMRETSTFDSCFRSRAQKLKGKSSSVCKWYGVTSKTIRDIWNRRTWTKATHHLWQGEIFTKQVSRTNARRPREITQNSSDEIMRDQRNRYDEYCEILPVNSMADIPDEALMMYSSRSGSFVDPFDENSSSSSDLYSI